LSTTTQERAGEARLTRTAFLGVRVEDELHDTLQELARENERSLSAEVRRGLRRHLAVERATDPVGNGIAP
jgi:predicted transcriptional regulator